MDEQVRSLFEPIKIGRLTAKNRIVMPPMNTNMACGDGFASERNRDYYGERAKGGAGVIILEALFIEWAAKHRAFGMGVSEDKFIPGLKMVAESIKEHGALAVAQINHNGRILSEDTTGLQTVAVSTYSNPATGELSIEFSAEEIQEMVEKYAQAARRIKEAGFDAVEVHGAHGYLLAQFISPFTNKRTDHYGGSLENRMRLPLQVVRRVKQVCGADYPVFYRISAQEYFQGGLEINESMVFAQKLEEAGVDLLDVSGSSLEQPHKLAKVIPCYYYQKGYHLASAEAMKKAVSIPVVGVGRIDCPKQAAQYIREGRVDMVAVGRQLIADPHWSNKAREGRLEDIIPCIACNIGCLGILLQNKRPITCVVNPEVGREKEYVILDAQNKKNVVVVGAGPAGLEAARVAALRGHRVTVLEKRGQIGGQLLLASRAPFKENLTRILDYYASQFEKLGISVNLGQEITSAELEGMSPDLVVLATGGKPRMMEEPWAMKRKLHSAWDVLGGSVTLGHKVVIVGGGRTGLETADYLTQRGHEVIVIEISPRIGSDTGLTVRPALMNRMIRSSVNVFNRAKVVDVVEKNVTIERDGDRMTLKGVDDLVLAVGTDPEKGLTPAKGASYDVYTIGDCSVPGGIMEAIAAGAELGRKL
jgi:2,4-dienoyl-CoA reductase-like NADH-dependent reductase (Old Yellow Enzyme family)/NADPH-dependent 2,4-dienoyl-CoA reductase/sulfur reductase-like enzyme